MRGKARKVPQDRSPLAKRGCHGDCRLDFTACFSWQSPWPTETPLHQDVPHAQVRGWKTRATSAKLSHSFLRVGALARIHGSVWRHGASPAPGGPLADERASTHPPTASPLRCVASPPPDTEARLRRDTELHGKSRRKSQSGLTSSAYDVPQAIIPCGSVSGEARFRVRRRRGKPRAGAGAMSWRRTENLFTGPPTGIAPCRRRRLLSSPVSVFARSAQQTLRTLRGIILSEVAASRAHPLAPLEGLTSFGLTRAWSAH